MGERGLAPNSLGDRPSVRDGEQGRRFGQAVTRTCYKRLMLAGGKEIREPDEVIQDRNQYPEPVEVYRLTDEEHAKIQGR